MNEIQYGPYFFVLLIDYFIECKDSLMVSEQKQDIFHIL